MSTAPKDQCPLPAERGSKGKTKMDLDQTPGRVPDSGAKHPASDFPKEDNQEVEKEASPNPH